MGLLFVMLSGFGRGWVKIGSTELDRVKFRPGDFDFEPDGFAGE
jgi:hypothetical protein